LIIDEGSAETIAQLMFQNLMEFCDDNLSPEQTILIIVYPDHDNRNLSEFKKKNKLLSTIQKICKCK
jgi:hypothetical protein